MVAGSSPLTILYTKMVIAKEVLLKWNLTLLIKGYKKVKPKQNENLSDERNRGLVKKLLKWFEIYVSVGNLPGAELSVVQ